MLLRFGRSEGAADPALSACTLVTAKPRCHQIGLGGIRSAGLRLGVPHLFEGTFEKVQKRLLRPTLKELADEGTARRRTVKTGIVEEERVQIVEGIAPGDLVVVKGQRDLEDGQAVALP